MKNIKLFEEFWGTEASGILPICRTTKRILIGLRSESVKEPLTWGNFGGAIGLNDDGSQDTILPPKENAVKEMREELGYDGEIETVPSFIFKKGNFIYHNFLGIVEKEFEPDLNWEVADYEWVTYDELINQEELHFGLVSLLENASEQIKEILNQIYNA